MKRISTSMPGLTPKLWLLGEGFKTVSLDQQRKFLKDPLWDDFIYPTEVWQDCPAWWIDELQFGVPDDWDECRKYFRILKSSAEFDPYRHAFQVSIIPDRTDDIIKETKLQRTFISDRDEYHSNLDVRRKEEDSDYYTSINAVNLLDINGIPYPTLGISWTPGNEHLPVKFDTEDNLLHILDVAIRGMGLDQVQIECRFVAPEGHPAAPRTDWKKIKAENDKLRGEIHEATGVFTPEIAWYTFLSPTAVDRLPPGRIEKLMRHAYRCLEHEKGIILQACPVEDFATGEYFYRLQSLNRVCFSGEE